MENPVIPANRLTGFQNHFKIKLRASGYRLVYEVEEGKVRILVIAVGKRDKSSVYTKARKRTLGSEK
ncbi:MAG: type II toxin-antitoxin system RelE/ParE family toxin [bacterium]|nr:type II toxin-antitoxin system RelE/ParE family toxin [bacterium]